MRNLGVKADHEIFSHLGNIDFFIHASHRGIDLKLHGAVCNIDK